MTIAHRIEELVICTKSPYDDLLGTLPAANRLDSICVIDQVRITVGRPAQDFVHVVQGLAKDANGSSRTLKMHSSAAVPRYSELDLQRLFRGFAPNFLPTVLPWKERGMGMVCQRRRVRRQKMTGEVEETYDADNFFFFFFGRSSHSEPESSGASSSSSSSP